MEEKYLKKIEYDKIIKILADYADSAPGKSSVERIFPSTEYDTIISDLNTLKSAMYFIKVKGKPDFEGLTDVSGIIKRLSLQGVLSTKELLIIRDNSCIARRVSETSQTLNPNNADEYDIKKIIEHIVPLYDIESEIRRCILSEEDIADDASKELLRIRNSILKNQEAIKDKLLSFTGSDKYRKYMQDNIITMRQDRYVIPIKSEYRNVVKGVIHDTSQTGSTLFIEPMEIVNMNNKIRELINDEKKEIERILRKLSEQCAIYKDEILSNFNICCNLDVMFAKAAYAMSYSGTIPGINKNREIRLLNAKHPLIPEDIVVPIDFKIGKNFRILVITGPNTGGKTVTLKTVGLLTAMAHAGLAIPADEGSEICVFNSIYADIGDEQSIEQNLSTFSSHMTNIINILKNADDLSLVLLDELGAGTDPVEGSALASAIIETLRNRNITTVATTHYTELKTYASVTENVENASCEFDVKTLKPTFRLLIGIPGKSNAIYISRRLGLDEEIIKMAKSSIDNKSSDYENVILSLEKSRQRMEKDRIKATEYKKEIEEIKKQLEKERDGIDKERDKILEKAKKDAKKLIEKALDKAQHLINEIDELKKSNITVNAKTEADFRTTVRKTKEILEIKDADQENDKDITTDDIKSGDTVMLRNLKQRADVLSNPDKDGNIIVQAGIIKMTVNIKDVYKIDEQKEINKNLKMNVIKTSGPAKMELDIRGNTIFEAESKLDKFIEQGYFAGLHELSVIHGKGTGALRKGVHDYLKSNPYISSFRLGVYGEGESGITVIFLKDKNK
ncbi:MAG TPA: endonuclease MutS2 [Clostridia bacterium]|jgi:DNA mismatch repair protein MutS2|nr:endonuclease MutS2 [Clostridiaceae bacterium]HOF25923.1 endonuclease MutS2 [Clostridia bacterium]HOM33634.1 endonuclease MutS2 [Clostridia bacterium]HOR88948.1 endonuclease MutS2 [Clostridia bacterium]HOT71329.1 endonuclease MutS2 [Clostridia bacterium]